MSRHDVVIAGGGPTGLMLAGELALAGVDVVDRRAPRQPGRRRVASRRPPRPHDRGARPARHRRAVPRRGPGHAGRWASPRSRSTSATSRPATTTGSRSGRATSSGSWPTGSTSSGCRRSARPRGRRASRRTTTASTSSCPTARRCERRTSSAATAGAAWSARPPASTSPGSDPSTSWMIAEVEMDEEPRDRHPRREGGGIGPVDRRRAAAARTASCCSEPRRRARRRARRCDDLRDALVAAYGTDFGAAQPDAGSPASPTCRARRRPTAPAGCCSPATPPTSTRRRAARASTSACRTP